MKKVLFVCLGNICRSPMAEGMMQYLVEKNDLIDNYFVDSAGTSAYHVGEKADKRMRETAKNHGVELKGRSRQVQYTDFEEFDIILAMDESNYNNLKELADQNVINASHVRMMREFDSERDSINVPDPYYGGEEGFEEVFQIMERSCSELFNQLEKGEL